MLRQLFKFHGGVKPATHKAESTALPIGAVPLAAELVIPLHQSVGGTPRPLVQAGDLVKKGQRIGRNPKTGKEVPISPRRVMVFKPSAILKQQINEGSPEGAVEPAPAAQAPR